MPSLKALEEFKTKFSLISREDNSNLATNSPYDDLPLPDHEPSALPEPAETTDSSIDDEALFENGGNGFQTEPDDFSDSPADVFSDIDSSSGSPLDDLFDMGDLLGGFNLDAPVETAPSIDDLFPEENIPDDTDLTLETPNGSIEDFDINDLNGFSVSDLDSAEPEQTLPEVDLPDESLPNFDDLGIELGASEDFPDLNEQSLPDFSDLEAEVSAESGDDFADFADLEESADSTEIDDSTAEALPDIDEFNLDLGEFPDLGDGSSDFADQSDSGDLPDLDDLLNLGDQPDSGDLNGLSDLDDLLNPGGLSYLGDQPDSTNLSDSLNLPDSDDLSDLTDFSELPEFAETSDDFLTENLPAEDLAPVDLSSDDFTTDDLSSGDSLDLPDSSFDEFNLDIGELPDFDAGSSDFPGSTEDSGGGLPADENFGSFGDDIDFGASDISFDDLPEGGEAFDVPVESFGTDDLASGEDTFDSFNLDNDVSSSDFGLNVDAELVDKELDKDLADLGDFNIPGLDDLGTEAPGKQPAKTASFSSPSAAENEVEEIHLSDREFRRLEAAILSYPLNLRIACAQIIAEEAVPPDLMSSFVKMLTRGASAKEASALAGKILSKTISIPKGYEKKTGEDFEEEQNSFGYIFVHKFLPVFRLYLAIALVALSLGYLAWSYIYIPLKAEGIYKQGYDRIAAGEYNWANMRFNEAFETYPKKAWFYRYAEAFRDERQYIEAEKKYQQLMYYTASKSKRGIPEKQAVLDYAALATYYMRDFEKADTLLRRDILDYYLYDKEALLALGDNSLAWGEIEPARLDDAREAYAAYMERYGQTDPVLERMLKYLILTDNLQEVLPLQKYFMASEKRHISAVTLSDLGGYLIDKRTEEVRGVPNEFIANIGGIRDVLLRAIRTDQMLPESYYHLARYYREMNSVNDEAYTLERALQAFGMAHEESPRRLGYNIGAIRRYAEILIHRREFFPAEEQLIKGVNLYENGIDRRLLTRTPEYGMLYADLGDLEYFVKSGDMDAAIDYYLRAEQSGYSPPELRYRIGAAHYQLGNWPEALNRFVDASGDMPFNRRILHALGNVSYMRGNLNAAHAYYDRLLSILDADRARRPPIMPTDDKEDLDLAERLMVTQNNMGVVLDALASRTGDNRYRSRALGLFAESERAWDIVTRNPETMIRMRPSPEINAPGVNPAYLNVQNSLHPVATYEPQFFLRIDKDILEPSMWDDLAPPAYRLSQGLATGFY